MDRDVGGLGQGVYGAGFALRRLRVLCLSGLTRWLPGNGRLCGARAKICSALGCALRCRLFIGGGAACLIAIGLLLYLNAYNTQFRLIRPPRRLFRVLLQCLAPRDTIIKTHHGDAFLPPFSPPARMRFFFFFASPGSFPRWAMGIDGSLELLVWGGLCFLGRVLSLPTGMLDEDELTRAPPTTPLSPVMFHIP